jgi:hypothetical protein
MTSTVILIPLNLFDTSPKIGICMSSLALRRSRIGMNILSEMILPLIYSGSPSRTPLRCHGGLDSGVFKSHFYPDQRRLFLVAGDFPGRL